MSHRNKEVFDEIEEVKKRDKVKEHDVVGICQHEDCRAKIRVHIHRKEDEIAYIPIICPKCKRDPGVVEKFKE